MNLQDLNELDFENIGAWPKIAKIIFVLIVCVGLSAAYYFYQIEGEQKKLEQVEAKEQELRNVFEAKAAIAGNLPAYKEQVEKMSEAFASLLKQLPEKHEIPGLIDELSFIGIDNGLEFKKINWQAEVEHEFSTELPIKIEVTGEYHQLGAFVSSVAALPRIVILEDITLKKQGEEGRLVMGMLAKTYRYKEAKQGAKK